MNRYCMPVVCHICGGPGAMAAEDAGMDWIAGVRIHHVDPAVCRDYLQAAKRKQEAAYKKQESAYQG